MRCKHVPRSKAHTVAVAVGYTLVLVPAAIYALLTRRTTLAWLREDVPAQYRLLWSQYRSGIEVVFYDEAEE